MAKINIEDIRKEIEPDGWKLISDTYKNLDEVLVFECSEGHKVYAPWKKIRTKRECPKCKENKYANQDSKILPKKKGVIRILALDQATYDSGWSIYDDGKLVKYGVFSTTSETEVERANDIKVWLINMINNWHPDFIGIEGIQFQETSTSRSGDTSHKSRMGVTVFQALARLQGVLLDTCFEAKIPTEVCPTNTWRSHCKVKGRTRTDKKRSMQLIAKEWFDVSVTEDEADSIGIGKYMSDIKSSQNQIVEWE